jgi:UDP-3-O-[3-hydroxymyristoyl] glucosamine N-acyltransferase
MESAKIGEGCIINMGTTIDHDCNIGAFSHVAAGCSLPGRVSIGENCLIGLGTGFLPEKTIGNNVTIRAGSIVTRDIPSDTLAGGIPAAVLKTIVR